MRMIHIKAYVVSCTSCHVSCVGAYDSSITETHRGRFNYQQWLNQYTTPLTWVSGTCCMSHATCTSHITCLCMQVASISQLSRAGITCRASCHAHARSCRQLLSRTKQQERTEGLTSDVHAYVRCLATFISLRICMLHFLFLKLLELLASSNQSSTLVPMSALCTCYFISPPSRLHRACIC